MPEVRDRLAYRFERLLNERVLTDPNVFYEDCRSTDSRWVLAAKNLMAPERLLARARYAQALGVPVWFSRAQPAASPPPDLDQAEVARLVAEFGQNGVVQLPGDRTELVRSIVERYEAMADRHEPADHYTRTLLDPTSDSDALVLVTDPLLLAILAGHYGAQPFVRDAPTVNITYPNVTSKEARGRDTDWASEWHWDTPNLLSVHVMLCDIEPDGTRMLYARGSHRRSHVHIGGTDRWYSEEFVRSRYSVFDCAGPQGSVFVFDNNGLHRLEAVPNRFRASFEFYFTPGNSLHSLAERSRMEETDWVRLHERLRNGQRGELPPLSPLQRRALAGLLSEVPAGRR